MSFSLVFCIPLFLILFVYLFYKKLIIITFSFLNILFFVALFSAIVTLFSPDFFKRVSTMLIDRTFIVSSFRDVDATIASVTTFPETMKNKVLSFLQQRNNAEGEDHSIDHHKQQGYLETVVLPEIINLVAFILRVVACAVSFVIMIAVVYCRYAFAGLNDVARLEHRVKVLEHYVQQDR